MPKHWHIINKRQGKMEQSKKVIPIFYASDKNYIPYLAVSILSVRASRSKDFNYKIHVLCAGELNGQDEEIKGMEEEGFSIEFIDVEKERARLEGELKKLEGEIKRLEGKLSNAGFVAKAPAAVVDAERAKLAKYEENLAGVKDALAKLK